MKQYTENVREKTIEDRLRVGVRKLHGRAYKFISPGHDGVPDRIILLPGARILFVETKAPGKTPTPLQLGQIEYIKALGFRVEVIDNAIDVDILLQELALRQAVTKVNAQLGRGEIE